MINKIDKAEILTDAVAHAKNAFKPDSEAYILRNPLLLKSFSRPGRHPVTEQGVRVFDSFLGGYRAGLFDVQAKLSGKSNSGIQKTDKLRNLLAVYSIKQEPEILQVVYFLRKAFQDPNISQNTSLSYFLLD